MEERNKEYVFFVEIGMIGKERHIVHPAKKYINIQGRDTTLKKDIRMPSKHFAEILKKMQEIHDRKSHDYATEQDPMSNFKRAGEITSWFSNPIDQVFAGIIGIKLARLAELRNGKLPKNESIQDTFLDLSNYCVLWYCYHEELSPFNQIKDKMNEAINQSLSIHLAEDEKNKEEKGYMGSMNVIKGEGERSGVPVLYSLPHLCSNCNQGDMSDRVNHAIVMHSAKYNAQQRSLKYPTISTLFLIDPIEHINIPTI